MAHLSEVAITGSRLGAKHICPEPFNRNVEVNNSSTGAVLHDTEVLHDLDSIESLETQLLDECDTEVVPDSDDEEVYAAKGKGFSCRGSLLNDASSSFSPCEQQRHPVVNTDACADEGHVSGMIVCRGNGYSPITVQSEAQATELHYKDSRASEVKDADFVNPISCAASCSDDTTLLREEVKFDHDVKTSQRKIREVRTVYTRKKKRTNFCFEGKLGQEESRAPNNSSECAGLSYVDSHEPEDLSKALLFVDKFLSVSGFDSSPVANVTIKDKSPPVLSAKGVQSLVRLAKLRDRTDGTRIFEWDYSQETDGHSDYLSKRSQLSLQGNKYDKIYLRRSSNLKDVMPKKRENPSIFCKEETESFNNNETVEDSTHLDAKLAVYDFDTVEETKQVDENKAREDSDAELNQPTNQECAYMQLENAAVHEESGHIFDVGIDTQIAAEAIQALSFAAPAGCSDLDADQCCKPLGGTQKTNHAGVWSFPKKSRSTSRGIVTEPIDNRKYLCFDNPKEKMKTLKLDRRKKGPKLIAECLDERSFGNSDKAKFIKKTKIKGAKGVTDGFKENANSLVLEEDMPLCILKRSRKQQDSYPLAGNLKTPSLFNMDEGLMNESMEGKINHVKVGLHDKREDTVGIEHTVEVSAQIENHSKLLCKQSRNSGIMKGSKENETSAVIDKSAIVTSVDGEVDQLELDLQDKGNEGSISASTFKVYSSIESFCKGPSSKWDDTGSTKTVQDGPYVAPKSCFWSGYAKGKRMCSSMLSHPDGSCDLKLSSAKTRMELSNQCSLRSQFNSESLFNSFFSGSNTKRKRRSSVYISPCWIASNMKCKQSFLLNSVGEPRQREIHVNESALANKKSTSEQLFKGGIAMAHREGFYCSMDGARRIDHEGVAQNKNLKSHVSDHVMSPKCPPLTDETNLISMINDYQEQAGKKKAILPSLTRELVQLGFNDPISELTPKGSRRRKAMANIRVLLSRSLDKSTLKHQQKILMRLGLPMVSCPSVATHFIADKFARTRNMLEFIAMGKPVVTHMWLESCEQAGFYINEKKYILRDVKKERELGFIMPRSLDLARKHPLLKGYRVYITPNTQPGLDLLTNLVKAAHGQAVNLFKDCANMTLDNLLILSCEDDQDCWVPFLKRGVAAYSPELILNGIIIQKLELERHRLFTNHVKGH